MQAYREALINAFRDCGVQPLMLPLQISDEVDSPAMNPADRHRLSVACGLTSDAALRARITASKDIPDLHPFTQRANLLERDELYPK